CMTEGQSATIAANSNETGNTGAFIIHIMLRSHSIDQQDGSGFQLIEEEATDGPPWTTSAESARSKGQKGIGKSSNDKSMPREISWLVSRVYPSGFVSG